MDKALAFLRITAAGSQDGLATIAVAWAEDVGLIAERTGVRTTIRRCDLTLTPDDATAYAELLDGPVRGVTAVIGNVAGGQWISGPFCGQPAP